MSRLPRWWADLTAVLVLVLLMIGSYGYTLQANAYYPKDVWESLLITAEQPIHPQIQRDPPAYTAYYDNFWGYAFERELVLGRFRPVYWTITTFEAHLLRDHPRMWYLETLIIGAISAALIYAAVRRIGIGVLAAWVGAALLITSGWNLWVEIAVAEEPALLLTALALLLLVEGARRGKLTGYDWAALLLMLLAGFIKESFTLIIPAALLGRGTLHWLWFQRIAFRQALIDLLPLAIASALLVVGQLGVHATVYRMGFFSAAVVGDPLNSWEAPIRWLIYAGFHGQRVGFYLPIIAAGLLLTRRAADRPLVLMLLGVGFAWIMPQLILYTNRGGTPYYFYPTAIWLVMLTSFATEWLRRQVSHRWLVILLVGLGIAAYGQVRVNRSVAEQFTAQAQGFNRQIAQITDGVGCDTGGHFLYYSGRSADEGASLLTLLGERGCRATLDLYVPNTVVRDPIAQVSMRLLTDLFPAYHPRNLDTISAVIVDGTLDDLTENPFPGYNASDWEVLSVDQPYRRYPRWSLQTESLMWSAVILVKR